MAKSSNPQGVVPDAFALSVGHPDPTSIPIEHLEAAVEAVFDSPQVRSMLQYGSEQGPARLVDHLVNKHNQEENLNIHGTNLMVVAGSTHAIDMIARLFGKPGGSVLVEAPTYKDAIHIFRDHGLALHSVPMDNDGVIVEELEKKLALLHSKDETPGLFYTIPNFQNPSGVTVPTARREQIIELASRYGFLIVEDDVYRDLVFEGEVPASYFALAAGGQHVIRIGSFSKTLAPGLRMGWLIASREHVERCMNCGATQMGGGANPFVSHFVAEYCSTGQWDAHIPNLQNIYRQRRDVALTALERHMPQGVTWTVPKGGFFTWLTLPEGITVTALQEAARKRGMLFAEGTGFFVNGDHGQRHLRIAYSFAELRDIEEGLRALSQAIDELTSH